MRHLPTSPGIWRALLGALLASSLALLGTGCETSCEDSCQDAYDDCMERAPPGASRADCSDQYQRCMNSCLASGQPEEAEASPDQAPGAGQR